jgi:hypothetical protein
MMAERATMQSPTIQPSSVQGSMRMSKSARAVKATSAVSVAPGCIQIVQFL